MAKMMIESDILDKLQVKFQEAVDMIIKAAESKRPIWIRHHDDCDGYSGGVVLEKAILKRLHKRHMRESDVFYFYKRSATRTPYYDYIDANKDLAFILADEDRFSRKRPLVIIIDNGSSKQDLLALKKLKLYDIQTIVIDHHPADEENDKYLDVHINPMHHTDGYRFSAGMICSEIAGMIDEVEDRELFASLSGVADKIDGQEIEEYLKLAEAKGFSRDYLNDLASVVDFEVNHIAHLEARQYIQDLFFGNHERQREIVALVKPILDEVSSDVLKVVEKYAESFDYEDFFLGVIDIDQTFYRRDISNGKIANTALNYLSDKTSKPGVMLGMGKEFITFRISKELDLDMNKIRLHLMDKFPFALVRGGGHAKAGTISFSEITREIIFEEIKDYLKK